jgi:hypothetical protein
MMVMNRMNWMNREHGIVLCLLNKFVDMDLHTLHGTHTAHVARTTTIFIYFRLNHDVAKHSRARQGADADSCACTSARCCSLSRSAAAATTKQNVDLAQKQRHLLVTHTACNLHRYSVRNQWIKGKKPYLIRLIQVSSLGQQHASGTVLTEQRERGRQQNIMSVAADKCMA